MRPRVLAAVAFAAVALGGVLPASAAARFPVLMITVSATQSARTTGGGPYCPGARSAEGIVVPAAAPARYFLKPSALGGIGLSRTTTIVSNATIDRTITSCDPGERPKCGTRRLRTVVDAKILTTATGRVRGISIEVTPDPVKNPFRSCGDDVIWLTPPLSDFMPSGFPNRLEPVRYVYAPLPRGLASGCTRRRVTVSGRGLETRKDVESVSQTTMRFTVVLRRVGCLGR